MTTVNLEDKLVVLLDDMFDTVTTIDAAYERINSYDPYKIIAAGTHALFSPKKKKGYPIKALDKLRKAKLGVVITDSIPYPDKFYIDNNDVIIDVISLAHSIADVQLKNRTLFSVSRSLDQLEDEIKDHAKKGKTYQDISDIIYQPSKSD